jgi:hypothetical protein
MKITDMTKITADFANNQVTYVTEDGQANTICVPDLSDRTKQIIEAMGLTLTSMDEVRNDIDDLFSRLGIDVKCDTTDKK